MEQGTTKTAKLLQPLQEYLSRVDIMIAAVGCDHLHNAVLRVTSIMQENEELKQQIALICEALEVNNNWANAVRKAQRLCRDSDETFTT
jgi:hypothetical protein